MCGGCGWAEGGCCGFDGVRHAAGVPYGGGAVSWSVGGMRRWCSCRGPGKAAGQAPAATRFTDKTGGLVGPPVEFAKGAGVFAGAFVDAIN